MASYIQTALEVIGAIGTLATALAHLPLPVKWAALFARIGAASLKFDVTVKGASDGKAG